MAGLTLLYCEDERTGLPRLEDPGGRLSGPDREAIGREIGRQFEHLASGPDGQVLTLNGTASPEVPCLYRVTVSDRRKRCPTLLLEAVEQPPTRNAAAVASDTATLKSPPSSTDYLQGRFVADVAEWLEGVAGEIGANPSFRFVLADLRALLRKDPALLARLLFAGYLHVGDALSLRHGESVDNNYARAAQALARLPASQLPEGVFDPFLSSPAVPPSGPADPPAARPTG